MVEHHGESGSCSGAAAFYGALGDAEEGSGVGHRVTLHVDGDEGCSLLDGKLHQCGTDNEGGVDLRGPIRHRVRIVDLQGGGVAPRAPELITAGVHDDSMQPSADCRVVPNGSGVSMSGEQCVLQGFARVFGTSARAPCDPVEPAVVAGYQLGERVPVAGRMSCQ